MAAIPGHGSSRRSGLEPDVSSWGRNVPRLAVVPEMCKVKSSCDHVFKTPRSSCA